MDFEKLGVFYLGRECDPSGVKLGDPVLYDSRDLVTHGVCIGMTGSGKTGLCLSLIEEAAIDGVPVIAIDPKGDLTNLLLTFPNLAPSDFRPWIDEDEARRNGLSPDAFAAQQAETWKKGLAEWGQDGARIARLKASAEFAIYTPGSRAGLPISILGSFAAPPQSIRDDGEALAERAGAAAQSLLTLAGADAEPRGREHTFLSTVLATAWRAGTDLDLPAIIQQTQTPPFQKIGVLEVESFYPSKDRFALAMQLNGVLAAPGFDQWLEGEPLDAGHLLYGAKGKPRVSIMSIAHLGDTERMFFVSLLLNQVVSWMRTQSGTSSLRALVYMDEIAGYFPPVANPPSKPPLLTLLKQARAFGIGVLLASQNTVDLDYKGLGNTGTWFLGRLQTERDKARVLDGLEGAAAGSFDRAEADRTLSSLGKRVFLLHDVHAKAPITFQSRWAMSYLRGPLSRDQIHTLMADRQGAAAPAAASSAAREPARVAAQVAPTAPRPAENVSSTAPVLPPDVRQYFLPAEGTASQYRPVALGVARVTYSDPKQGLNETRDIVAATFMSDDAVPVDWESADVLDITVKDLSAKPEEGVPFGSLPKAAAIPKSYVGWQKGFVLWVSNSQTLELLRHAGLGLTANAGESERDFRIRVQAAQREARDEAVDAVRRKFAEKRVRLEAALQRAQQAVDREQSQATAAKLQTAVSIGATVLGAFLGRRAVSMSTLGRATTAARGVGRSAKEQEDVQRAQGGVEEAKKALDDLDAEIAEETKAIAARYDADADAIDKVKVAPKRSQISVEMVALGWRPE